MSDTPTSPTPEYVAVPEDEFNRLLRSIFNGMDALEARVADLETSLRIESAILEAVLGRE